MVVKLGFATKCGRFGELRRFLTKI